MLEQARAAGRSGLLLLLLRRRLLLLLLVDYDRYYYYHYPSYYQPSPFAALALGTCPGPSLSLLGLCP